MLSPIPAGNSIQVSCKILKVAHGRKLKPYDKNADQTRAEDSTKSSDDDSPAHPMEALATKAKLAAIFFEVNTLNKKLDMFLEQILLKAPHLKTSNSVL